MRLAAIDARTASFPLSRERLDIGGVRRLRREYSVVRVSCADGVTGFAYALARGVSAPRIITDWIGSVLREEEITDVAETTHALERQLSSVGAEDVVARAISLVDMALWSIAAQRAGVPLYALLNRRSNQNTEPVPVYRVAVRESGENDEEYSARLRNLREQGYAGVKIVFRPDRESTLRELRLIRDAIGEEGVIIVDGHWSFTSLEDGVEQCRWLEDEDIAWVEDPFPISFSARLVKELRARAPVAIGVGDEMPRARVLELIELDALDVVRVCVSTQGGVSGARDVIEAALSSGLTVSPHVHPEISQHLAFAWPQITHVEMYPPEGTNDASEVFLTEASRLVPVGGRLPVPTGSGSGLEIDWDVVEAHTVPGPTAEL
jgi:L-alanine-DL-glutamate epimerase-like enolase superfamily enzyme